MTDEKENFFSPEQHLPTSDTFDVLPMSAGVQEGWPQEALDFVEPNSLKCDDPPSPTEIKARIFASELKAEQKMKNAASARMQASSVLRANVYFKSTLVVMSSGVYGEGGAAIFKETAHEVRVIKLEIYTFSSYLSTLAQLTLSFFKCDRRILGGEGTQAADRRVVDRAHREFTIGQKDHSAG